MWWLRVVLLLGWSVSVDAATVCRETVTGKIIQSQLENAIGSCQTDLVVKNPQYGYAVADIEELIVSQADWKPLLDAWERNPTNPHAQKVAFEKANRNQKRMTLKSKLGLTEQEMQDLEDVVRRP